MVMPVDCSLPYPSYLIHAKAAIRAYNTLHNHFIEPYSEFLVEKCSRLGLLATFLMVISARSIPIDIDWEGPRLLPLLLEWK